VTNPQPGSYPRKDSGSPTALHLLPLSLRTCVPQFDTMNSPVERNESGTGGTPQYTGGRALLSYLCAFALIAVFVVAAVGVWDAGVNKTYPVRQAIEWNWRARATNNLIDMASNLNRSYAILGPYHGNPSWWFPTPDTDFDQIKANIRESRETALAVAANESIGSFGYQQAVQNLQETIVEINEHLELAKGWFVRTQAAAGLALLYVLLTLVAAGAARAAYKRDKESGYLAGGLLLLVWLVGTLSVGVLLVIIP